MEAIFFDFDGTLTDINQREVEVISETLNYFGMKVSRSRVKQLCAQTASYMDVFKKLGFELTDDALHYWTSAFIKGYRFSLVRRGVESTLKALSKKYLLDCVTSRETLEEVIRELRFLRIDGLFNHVITRDVAAKHFGLDSLPFFPFHEQRKKLYECALALAKCRPSSAVVVGDMGGNSDPQKNWELQRLVLLRTKRGKGNCERRQIF